VRACEFAACLAAGHPRGASFRVAGIRSQDLCGKTHVDLGQLVGKPRRQVSGTFGFHRPHLRRHPCPRRRQSRSMAADASLRSASRAGRLLATSKWQANALPSGVVPRQHRKGRLQAPTGIPTQQPQVEALVLLLPPTRYIDNSVTPARIDAPAWAGRRWCGEALTIRRSGGRSSILVRRCRGGTPLRSGRRTGVARPALPPGRAPGATAGGQ